MLREDFRSAFYNLCLECYSLLDLKSSFLFGLFLHPWQQNLPRLRFNKEGNLLAVTTLDNGFKILANAEGLRLLQPFGSRPFEAMRGQFEASPIKVVTLLTTRDS